MLPRREPQVSSRDGAILRQNGVVGRT